jgi:GNAT superfamily N-acetyltransferase
MIRAATSADLPDMLAIRDTAGDDRLSNPVLLTEAVARRLLAAGAVWVWREPGGPIAGFVAVDAGEGAIAALLVKPGERNRGIGRGLLAAGLDALRRAGHKTAILALEPGAPAERHYRAAGWTIIRENEDAWVLEKAL